MKPKEIIDSAIGYTPQEEAVKSVAFYVKWQRALKLLAVCLLLVLLVFFITGNTFARHITDAVTLLIVAVYILGKRFYGKGVHSILDSKCDPPSFCDRIYVLASYAKNEEHYFESIWNFSRGLKYWGRYEDMYKVLALAAGSIKTSRDAFLFNCALCDYAFETSNSEMVESFADAVAQLSPSLPSRKYQEMCLARLTERDLLRLEKAGEYSALYDAYVFADSSLNENKAQRIVRNYRISLLAKKLGLEKEWQARLEYVVNEGNKIWYVPAALESMASNSNESSNNCQ